MPKLSPAANRILFIGVCCAIGIFSILVWVSVYSVVRQSPALGLQPIPQISTDKTVRAVWNSGLYTENISAAAIFWLDNDTILVRANNGPKPRTLEGRRARLDWLYLWRLGEKPNPYGNDPHAATKGPHCAARGEISYHVEIVDPTTGTRSRTRWLGPPGEEREIAPLNQLRASFAMNPPSIERTDCEIYGDKAMIGTQYTTDSEHRFYLDFGADPVLAAVHAKPEQPIVLMRADGSERVALPISNAQAGPGSTHFHGFDGMFYLANHILTASPINHLANWRDTKCWPFWRVDPQTAKTERLCIPFGPWSGINGGATIVDLAPTKTALFFSARSINVKDESGFYRLDNGAVSRIFPGSVESPSISPNGCRIAFNYVPTYDAHGVYSPISSSIVAIDVCSPSSSAPSSSKLK